MFLPKQDGGMGIRNFEIFNRALLAKQAWRLITMPNSFMTRVLKAKYFPTTSFMEANEHSNISFTWRSILSVKNLISKGLCRVIGDGRTTNMWHDPWVPGLPECRVQRGVREGVMSEYRGVHELMLDGHWNVELLDEVFNGEESRAIQRIPLPRHDSKDEWMWYHNANGKFSVRSAYFIELHSSQSSKPSSSSPHRSKIWKYLWSANVPQKVKMFGWRMLRNALPVRANLASRGMKVNKVCERCGEADETLDHMFMRCVESTRVWYASPLRLEPDKVKGGSVRDWVEALLAHKQEAVWWELFWMLCWGIWKGRNAWVFEQKKYVFMEVVERAVRGVWEFQKEPDSIQRNVLGGEMEVRWNAPREGVYKLNTDAAIIKEVGIGMGGVVRDEEGDVMLATCCGLRGISDVDIAEALSARHGLQIASEAGLRNLVLEVDCKKLFLYLSEKIHEISPFGKIVSDIIEFASHCSCISFSHVKRQGNKVAHLLAQLCKSDMELRVWIDEAPVEVASAVLLDKASES